MGAGEKGRPCALVVDDNPVNREVLARFLEEAGCVCELAVDGKEAVELFAARRHGLVLMDLHMPGCDGWAAARDMRALEAAAGERWRAAIIAVTADSMGSDLRQAREAGMDSHLVKPITPEQVRNLVHQHFRDAES